MTIPSGVVGQSHGHDVAGEVGPVAGARVVKKPPPRMKRGCEVQDVVAGSG
jgi:hypothetical protein